MMQHAELRDRILLTTMQMLVQMFFCAFTLDVRSS